MARSIAEAQLDGAGEGGHERDLGHQQDRRAAAGERLLGGAQVDLGLAGAGHPLQEERREARGVEDGGQPVEGVRLVVAQTDLGGASRGRASMWRSRERRSTWVNWRSTPSLTSRRTTAGVHSTAAVTSAVVAGRPMAARYSITALPAAERPALARWVARPPRRQLDGVDVAGRAGPVLLAADPPALGERGRAWRRGPAGAPTRGLELGDGHPPALAQGVDDHRRLGRVARQAPGRRASVSQTLRSPQGGRSEGSMERTTSPSGAM